MFRNLLSGRDADPMRDAPSLPAFTGSFETASREVLAFLRERLRFDLWMVTRTEGDDWVVLRTEDHGYGVHAGTVFRWSDSFCWRMVRGGGPRIAPVSAEVPAYAEAPIGRSVKIGAYVGVPLTYSDGSLFGTLCAIHPDPHPEEIVNELPLVELLAAMLSRLLNTELAAAESARRAERAEAEADTDAMTGLFNRRGWNRLLDAEDARCSRYGHTASVVSVDLDGLKAVNDASGHKAGDDLICLAARTIREVSRRSDVVARLGGDEFGVLCVECGGTEAESMVARLRKALEAAGVQASIGSAPRISADGLPQAWELADQRMYREKTSRGAHVLVNA